MVSAFVNIFLMISLNGATWVRFIIWLTLGIFVYFFYGMRNSSENIKGSHQNYLFPCLEKSYATMEETQVQENSNESNL